MEGRRREAARRALLTHRRSRAGGGLRASRPRRACYIERALDPTEDPLARSIDIDLERELGNIDIYLLDQILRGRIPRGSRVLDAGCGQGRNLVYLLRAGYPVSGVDESPEAIASVRRLASEIAPDVPPGSFRVEPVEAMSFPDASADVVLSSAVLHFARDHGHFDAMLFEMWRVLAPRGLFFARLASSIGMEDRMEPLGDGRYELPDGSERYLVDEAKLMDRSAALGGELVDPLKTTVVQNQRCMTTWVLRKRP